MKKIILSTAVATMFLTPVFSQTKEEIKSKTEKIEKTTTILNFGVRGNCGMCKKTIEKAANSVKGVTNAVWDVDKKKINVVFDGTKTNEQAIHDAIAASGYDTEKAIAKDVNYNKLPGCCQYVRKMKISGKSN